jgi:hypothetical protein
MQSSIIDESDQNSAYIVAPTLARDFGAET